MKNDDVLIDSFLTDIAQRTQSMTNLTIKLYYNVLKNFWKPLFPNKSLVEITKTELKQVLGEMRKHKNKFNYQYKTTTIHTYFAILSSFYEFCIEEKELERNPSSEIRFPKKEKRHIVFLTQKELRSIITKLTENTQTKDYYQKILLFYLPCIIGTRVSETSNLDLDSFDFDEKIVRVIGKGNKERIIALPINEPFFKETFAKYIEERKEKLVRIFGDQWKNEKALFVNNWGNKRSPRDIQRIIKKIREDYIPNKKLTPHKLRHTYGTLLASKGIDLNSLRELLGHSNINTTMIYVHATIENIQMQFDAIKPFDDLIDKT